MNFRVSMLLHGDAERKLAKTVKSSPFSSLLHVNFTVRERTAQEIVLLISFRSLECAWVGKICLFIFQEIVLTKRKSDKSGFRRWKKYCSGFNAKMPNRGLHN